MIIKTELENFVLVTGIKSEGGVLYLTFEKVLCINSNFAF